jgi:ribosomal protein L21E
MNTRVARFLAAVAVVVALSTSAHGNAPAGRYTASSGTVYDTKKERW